METAPATLDRAVLIEPRPVEKVWGGDRLTRHFGFALPGETPIGEAWLLYDRPEGSSRLRGGGTLNAALRRDPTAILGRGVTPGYGGRFPLLLKFLDARQQLSLQVHPDDEIARREHDGGKTEASVILDAGPDARFVRGLQPGVQPAALRSLAQTSPETDLDAIAADLLLSFRPQKGDCIEIPAGVVHAIGPDVVVFEVQQNSDVTYRICDWGRGRRVDTAKAVTAARAAATPAVRPAGARPVVPAVELADGGRQLVHNEFFCVRRYESSEPYALRTDGRFFTITVVGGAGVLEAGPGRRLPVRTGNTALVPACAEGVRVVPGRDLDLLVCDPGGV